MKSAKQLLCMALLLMGWQFGLCAAFEYAITNKSGSDATFWIDQKWAKGSGNFWVMVPAGKTQNFKAGESSELTHIQLQRSNKYQEAGRTDVTKLTNWKSQSGRDAAAHGQQVGNIQGTFVYDASGFKWHPNGWSKEGLPEGRYKKECRDCLYNKWSDTLRCECPYDNDGTSMWGGRMTQADGCKRYKTAWRGDDQVLTCE